MCRLKAEKSTNLNLEDHIYFVICYNSRMSKPEAKTPVAPATPTPNPKAFTGIKRAEVKVLKPGNLNPTEALRRLRDQ
jgi:hypothetical protein